MISNRCARKSLVINCNLIVSENDLTNELKSITYSYSIYRIKHRKNDWY